MDFVGLAGLPLSPCARPTIYPAISPPLRPLPHWPVLDTEPARPPESIPSNTESPVWTTTSSTAPTSGQPRDEAGSPPAPWQGRMRSSIACARCRRSKVKCENNGPGTRCHQCRHSGRECTYSEPMYSHNRRRDSLPGGAGADEEGQDADRERKRARKSIVKYVKKYATASSPTNGLGKSVPSDGLDPDLLTSTVWLELYDIFQLHFSADLPFLHRSTFAEPLQSTQTQRSSPSEPSSAERPPFPLEFLFAFLALTARLHAKIVAYHSPATQRRPSDPSIASHFYAVQARRTLSDRMMNNSDHTLERTQATLMLSLYEWGCCRGTTAWNLVCGAIHSAQCIGLDYEPDGKPRSQSATSDDEAQRLGIVRRKRDEPGKPDDSHGTKESQIFNQEIRRRTFWSCYIMDCYMSSGKYRPQKLDAERLRIRLPSSERSFLYGVNVRTLLLDGQPSKVHGSSETPTANSTRSPSSTHVRYNDAGMVPLEAGESEGLVSRYIKILQIWRKVVKWSCAGGRQCEEYPPWDSRSQFYSLNRECLNFEASLPRELTLSHQNTHAHIDERKSTPYLLVHTVYLLSQILLHREYVPFIPIRCKKPEGPLDPPLFPAEQTPVGFWEDSARQCFKAARGIADLARDCRKRNALIETPVMGFAIYIVAFTGVYAMSFPHMDPAGFMCTSSDADRSGLSLGYQAAQLSLQLLSEMRPRLKMARVWSQIITSMATYLGAKDENEKRLLPVERSDNDPVREPGLGGGLTEWKRFWRLLTDFGEVDALDLEVSAVKESLNSENPSNASSVERKSEDREHSKAPESDWNAINTIAIGRPPSVNGPTAYQFRESSYHNTSPTSAPPQHQTYAHQINNFRPAYGHDSHTQTSPQSHALPSPHNHNAATPSRHLSQERRESSSYGGWSQNTPYPMQPPTQTSWAASNHHVSAPAQYALSPMHSTPGYPTPSSYVQPAGPSLNGQFKDSWLEDLGNSIPHDDVIAFASGLDINHLAMNGNGNGNGNGKGSWGFETL